MPVGYPVEDREVLILSEDRETVAPDQVGEIAVKSRYLSPAYWRKPSLTQAAFAPEKEEKKERIYFTGDLGIVRSDGCLVHMGRKDFAIKIRGHRVEFAEVEAALLSHTGIREAVVMGRRDRFHSECLVAYLVPTGQPVPSVTQLRRYFAEKLPAYMIPQAFVSLIALPRTPNGKVDYHALPAPEPILTEQEETFVAPRTPIEEMLSDIWVQLLDVKRVGIHDNFFDLGGHSLLVTQVISRVRAAVDAEIPLRLFFESPTVASMALLIVQSRAKNSDSEEIADLLADIESLEEGQVSRLLPQAGKA